MPRNQKRDAVLQIKRVVVRLHVKEENFQSLTGALCISISPTIDYSLIVVMATSELISVIGVVSVKKVFTSANGELQDGNSIQFYAYCRYKKR